MKKNKFVALCLSMIVICPIFTSNTIYANEERGVIEYTEIISSQYEDGKQFSEGLAAVKKNGLWGYINQDNLLIIPFQYTYASNFNEGVAVVANEDGELGFINHDNELTIFKNSYDDRIAMNINQMWQPEQVTSNSIIFHNGVAIIPYSYVLFNKDGCAFYMDNSIQNGSNEGYIAVRETSYLRNYNYLVDVSDINNIKDEDVKSYHLYDKIEKEVLLDEYVCALLQYESAEMTLDEMLQNNDISDHYTGSYLDDDTIVSFLPPNQGLLPVWAYNPNYDEILFGFKNLEDFTWAIEPKFSGYFYSGVGTTNTFFGETGLAMVADPVTQKYGAINKQGETIIPFIYDELWSYTEGLSKFKLNGKYGLIDENLNVVVQPIYDNLSPFNNGYAVTLNGTSGTIIDRKGNVVAGSENVDTSAYFLTAPDGTMLVATPAKITTIKNNGLVGYAKVDYTTILPEPTALSDWAYPEVVSAIEHNVVPESLQNMYQNSITRAEFAALIMEVVQTFSGLTEEEFVKNVTGDSIYNIIATYPFVDSTSYKVISANVLGIISGYGDGVFDPYKSITRAEAAALLTRTASVLGLDVSGSPEATFNDDNEIAEWFKDSVDFVNSRGIMTTTGNDNFSPNALYTREQSYVTVYRLLMELYKG